MTKARFGQLISEPFVLDEERLKSIGKSLQDYAGEPSISVKCTDGGTLMFENLEKLFEYENAKNRRITSIEMSSYDVGQDREKTAIIDLSTMPFWGWLYPAIVMVIRGTEEEVLIVKRKLDEVIAGSRPWYSWISKINGFFLWWLFFVVTGLVLFVQFEWISLPEISSPINLSSRVIITTTTLWMTLWVVCVSSSPAFGAAYVIRRLFPSTVFLIGQEKKRYKTKEWVRQAVIVLVATAIITWLFSLAR